MLSCPSRDEAATHAHASQVACLPLGHLPLLTSLTFSHTTDAELHPPRRTHARRCPTRPRDTCAASRNMCCLAIHVHARTHLHAPHALTHLVPDPYLAGGSDSDVAWWRARIEQLQTGLRAWSAWEDDRTRREDAAAVIIQSQARAQGEQRSFQLALHEQRMRSPSGIRFLAARAPSRRIPTHTRARIGGVRSPHLALLTPASSPLTFLTVLSLSPPRVTGDE